MSCTTCQRVNTIPQCTQSLLIGVVQEISGTVKIYFTDILTGRKFTIEGSTDSDGLLTADISGLSDFLSPNYVFEVNVTDNAGAALTIAIGSNEYSCLAFEVEAIWDSEGNLVETETFTLSV